MALSRVSVGDRICFFLILNFRLLMCHVESVGAGICNFSPNCCDDAETAKSYVN